MSLLALVFTLVAGSIAIDAGAEERFLDVQVLSRGSGEVRLRLTNRSAKPLHATGPKQWGLANYIKIGFETVPFPQVLREGQWSDARPDRDNGLNRVVWSPTEALKDVAPNTAIELDVRLPPWEERGNVELVALARRGALWLTYRETITTRALLPGDIAPGLLRLLLVASLGAVAFRSRKRMPGHTAAAAARPTARFALGHSAGVLVLSGMALLYLHRLHYVEFPYSDGVNYAVLARSHAEGRGLVSPVILPGLMTLVPTDRAGQAFLIQAPLWPLLLSYVFRICQATSLVVATTGYALAALTALATWWIAVFASRRPYVGYLGAALLLTNPLFFAACANGSTVPLQSALVCGLVLLMWSPLGPWSAIAAGTLAGLGIVARENSVFVALGLAACWLPDVAASWKRGARLRLAAVLLAGVACAWVPIAMESARKAAALGRPGHPTLRATLLYATPGFDTNWYWVYDYAGLKVDPVAYFEAHPEALWAKMKSQMAVFLRKTLPALLSLSPWFVPVVLPWLLVAARASRAAWAVLLSMALQVLGAALSFLHPSYFVVFVPPLCALIAATVHALFERVFSGPGLTRRLLAGVMLLYALLPMLLNLSPMNTPRGVVMGDYWYDRRAPEQLMAFVREHTPKDAVIAFGHMPAPLLAWHTGRTIVSYNPDPVARVSNSEMWQRIDRKLPMDFILLSSFTDANTADVLEGFQLVATEETRWLKAWLYGRTPASEGGPSASPPPGR